MSANPVHADPSLWGYMEEIITNDVLYQLKPNTRPFIVGRAQFAGAGRKSAHWLGDNYSTWSNMQRSIQGVLQFNLFAMPMVGPDTCGFVDNSDEELCNRWMQLSAFYPFYRNHNSVGAIGQEPYRWDSVRNASITAIQARYAMLPIWESLFADAACAGTPPVRALFHEFDDPKYYNIHNQFLVGDSILVTPQLHPNSSTVSGVFPSADGVTWTNWFTHEVVDTSSGENVTVEAPLSTIPVHVRSGRVLLLHSNPAYTLTETRSGGYGLLVTLDGKGYAEGWAKLDDGLSWPGGYPYGCADLQSTSRRIWHSLPSLIAPCQRRAPVLTAFRLLLRRSPYSAPRTAPLFCSMAQRLHRIKYSTRPT